MAIHFVGIGKSTDHASGSTVLIRTSTEPGKSGLYHELADGLSAEQWVEVLQSLILSVKSHLVFTGNVSGPIH